MKGIRHISWLEGILLRDVPKSKAGSKRKAGKLGDVPKNKVR
jgi:hypothetical protein